MIFNPKAVNKSILESIKEETNQLEKDYPTLAILRIGNDIGSVSYEKSIKKTLEPLNIKVDSYIFDNDITQDKFINELEKLNNNPDIHSILIFRPLPEEFDEDLITSLINPQKDPDALNLVNTGKLFINDKSGFIPCTAQAVIELLNFYGIDIKSKNITIINNSNIIGKPLALLLTNAFATVTICHEFTKNLENFTKDADIVITAAGKYGLVKPEMLNEKATLIDLAITKMTDSENNIIYDENSKPIRCGDSLESCKDKVENIISATPGCGGGLGLITTALLGKNTLKAYNQAKGNIS